MLARKLCDCRWWPALFKGINLLRNTGTDPSPLCISSVKRALPNIGHGPLLTILSTVMPTKSERFCLQLLSKT